MDLAQIEAEYERRQKAIAARRTHHIEKLGRCFFNVCGETVDAVTKLEAWRKTQVDHVKGRADLDKIESVVTSESIRRACQHLVQTRSPEHIPLWARVAMKSLTL